MAGIAWVLGAGFSRALGGPSLLQLLSSASRARLAARYSSCQPAPEHPSAYLDSMLNAVGWERIEPGKRAWPDAEAFLEVLDLAAEPRIESRHRHTLGIYTGG